MSICDQCDLSNVYGNPTLNSIEWIVATIEQILTDQFQEEWLSVVKNSAKGLCYRIFKNDLSIEKYLTLLLRNLIYILCKFRYGNHRLPVETGRWQNVPRAERSCHFCAIGDEFHYMFECAFLKGTEKDFCRN